jgi:O-antigen/teichoic acid export membrane protein
MGDERQPLLAVALRAGREGIRRAYRAVLVLTVGASVAVALLGLFRQKAVANIVGPAGLADLSLLLSIGGPLAALALWPLISFAKDLNHAENPSYERSLRSAAATCVVGYSIGAVGLSAIAWRAEVFRYPLGSTPGLYAALLFGLGMVGIGFATSALTFRGDLRTWRRLALAVAVCQAAITAILGVAFGRAGAVWGMAGVTGAVGAALLCAPWFRARRTHGFHLPERWVAFSVANGLVMLTLASTESVLRQASATFSALTAAYFQASLSIIGAVSAGIAQYTSGRLLPVATAARDGGDARHVWHETRRAALVTGVFVVLICGGIALLAPTILSVAFSAEFDAATPLLRLVVLGEGAIALSTVVTATLLGLGKTSLWATLSIIPAVARVATYAVLSGSTATSRLGWSYAVAGFVSLSLCTASYVWMSQGGRRPPRPPL